MRVTVLFLSPPGAAALLAGPVGGAGGGEEEADGGHRPGASAGGGPAGSHAEGPAEGDRARLVSGEGDANASSILHSSVTLEITVFEQDLFPSSLCHSPTLQTTTSATLRLI